MQHLPNGTGERQPARTHAQDADILDFPDRAKNGLRERPLQDARRVEAECGFEARTPFADRRRLALPAFCFTFSAPQLRATPRIRSASLDSAAFIACFSHGRRLASARPVENAPDREIFAVLGELMLDASRDEQQIAGFERVAFAIVKHHAAPADDDIDLVLDMRGLLFRGDRNGECHIQGAALKDVNGMFTPRPREAFSS